MPQAKDSRNRWWDIVVQDQISSDCGYACAAMVCRYYHGANNQTAIDHMKGKSDLKGNLGQIGLSNLKIAAHVLTSMKVGVYEPEHFPVDQIMDKLYAFASKKTPMIVGLEVMLSNSSGTITSKHLTTAIDVASDGKVIFLDPFPGVGVVEVGADGVYTVPGMTVSFDGWVLVTKRP